MPTCVQGVGRLVRVHVPTCLRSVSASSLRRFAMSLSLGLRGASALQGRTGEGDGDRVRGSAMLGLGFGV